MQRRQRLPTAIAIVVLCAIWYYFFLFEYIIGGSAPNLLPGTFTLDFVDRTNQQRKNELSPQVKYSRTCIQPVFSSIVKRQEVTNISQSLLGPQVTVRLDRQPAEFEEALPECTTLKLTVPEAYPEKDIFPNLIFGIATSSERLLHSLDSIAHWAANRVCKVVAIVDDYEAQGAEKIQQIQDAYRKSGVRVVFSKPLSDSHMTSQSHFMVLSVMVKESNADTKWFGLLDDDTFFPHLKPLSDALERLDYTKDMYVGALAEDFESVKNFGLMAFGGAGAYLSVTLAFKLGAPDVAEQCSQTLPTEWGDVILRNCVNRFSHAKLLNLPGLYQHDMTGDLSGFFESGVEALNFHHWKSWYHEPVTKTAAAAKFCGNCFLQRWRFGADTVFSNGYSISIYRHGTEHLELDKMEKTFGQIYGGTDPHYEFTIGPLRDRVADGEKKSYHLMDTEIFDGIMRQLYVWKGNRDSGEHDEVVEIVWIK